MRIVHARKKKPTATPWAFRNSTVLANLCADCLRGAGDHHRSADLLASHDEEDRTVDAPGGTEPKCPERLLGTHARHAEGTDQVERHASQVTKQTETRNEDVL